MGEEHAARLTLKQIEELKQEISELRGLIEVQEHEIQQLKKSQQDFYLDLDKRLGQLQSEGPKAKRKITVSANDTVEIKEKISEVETLDASKVANAMGRAKGEPPQEGASQKSQDIHLEAVAPAAVKVEEAPAIRLQSSNTVVSDPLSQPTQASENVNLAPTVEKDLFESAYKMVRAKRYSEAVRAFRDYLTKFPTGEHAANAHYWLGEVYMSQWQTNKTKTELLDKANQEFLNITSKFPTHQKVTDALLKLGLIENEKGNLEAARQYLTEVKDRYPGTAAARIAETRLQQLHQ
jgi:tol-pal system protein YbgF